MDGMVYGLKPFIPPIWVVLDRNIFILVATGFV